MCEAFFEWQPMKAVPAPLDARRHVPIIAGRRRTRLGSVRATALLRCRKHAVEISASGHGWLSLAVKIKRRCRRSISGGVQGDAGLPPALGLRKRCVMLAGEKARGQGWAESGHLADAAPAHRGRDGNALVKGLQGE